MLELSNNETKRNKILGETYFRNSPTEKKIIFLLKTWATKLTCSFSNCFCFNDFHKKSYISSTLKVTWLTFVFGIFWNQNNKVMRQYHGLKQRRRTLRIHISLAPFGRKCQCSINFARWKFFKGKFWYILTETTTKKTKDIKVWNNQVFANTGHAVRLISAKIKWKMKEMERKKLFKIRTQLQNLIWSPLMS